MHELKFECQAEFLGCIPLDGNHNNIDPKSLSEYSRNLRNGDRSSKGACTLRLSLSGLSATFLASAVSGSEIDNYKFPFTSLLVAHMVDDNPKTTVWVVRESNSPDTVNAYVWRCNQEDDSRKLVDVFQQVRGKKKMEKLAQIRQKLEEKGLFANKIPINNSKHLCLAAPSPVTFKVSVGNGVISDKEGERTTGKFQPSALMPTSLDDSSKCQVTVKTSPKSFLVNGNKVLPTKEDATVMTPEQTGKLSNCQSPPSVDPSSSEASVRNAPSTSVENNNTNHIKSAVVLFNGDSSTEHVSQTSAENTVLAPMQQLHVNEKSKIELLMNANRPNPNRQVIVAAGRGAQKKPDTRQRQPARLISEHTHQTRALHGVTSKHKTSESNDVIPEMNRNKEAHNSSHHRDAVPRVQMLIPSLVDQQRAGLISTSYSLSDLGTASASWPSPAPTAVQNECNSLHYYAGLPSMSYGRWLKDSGGSGDPEINSRHFRKSKKSYGPRDRRSLSADERQRERDAEKNYAIHSASGARIHPHLALVNAKLRTAAVSRSESLNSQGSSSSSESVAENQPKSVLKKPKRIGREAPKKNVTFNAFATVQVMEV